MSETWFRKAINWIWYEKLTKQYNPQHHVENSIKDAKTQKFNPNTGKYESQPQLAKTEIVTKKDVVEYFIKDGLSEVGNANVFISMKGPRGDFNIGFDSSAITNPQFLKNFDVAKDKAKDSLGRENMAGKNTGVKASISYEAGYSIGPKLVASLGLGYAKLNGDFVLVSRLPVNIAFTEIDHQFNEQVEEAAGELLSLQRRNAVVLNSEEIETLNISNIYGAPLAGAGRMSNVSMRRNAIGTEPKEEIFPVGYYEMRGFNTEKEISGAVCLSCEAAVKASVSADAGANTTIPVTAKVGSLNANSLLNSKAGAKINGAAGVSLKLFDVSGSAKWDYAFFTCNAPLMLKNESQLRDNISDRVYNKIITYNKKEHSKIESFPPLEQVIKDDDIKYIAKDGDCYATVEMYTSKTAKNITLSSLEAKVKANAEAEGGCVVDASVEATLIDVSAKAYGYNSEKKQKGRKYRINLPIPSYDINNHQIAQNPAGMYTQDTEIHYCSEESYSYFGYEFNMKKCLGATLKFHDSEKNPNLFSFKAADAVWEKPTAENTLLYTSINSVWKPTEVLSVKTVNRLKGSCFTIGKSIDLLYLLAFYEKYNEIKKMPGGPVIRDILIANWKNIGIAHIMANDLKSYTRLRYGTKKYLSPQYDFVSREWSSKRFIDETYVRFAIRSSSRISNIDNALKVYLTSCKIFDNEKATFSQRLGEINKRVLLLENIKDAISDWREPKDKKNIDSNKISRERGVISFEQAVNKTLDYLRFTGEHFNLDQKLLNMYSLALEGEKLLQLYKKVTGLFSSLGIQMDLALQYILDKEVYLLVRDLAKANDIKAAIFETVFDINDIPAKAVGNKLYYKNGGDKDKYDSMSIPHSEYLSRCSNLTNKGMRILYRMEDSFEEIANIFQLGTRTFDLHKKIGLDINLQLSYKNQIGSFAAVTLYNLKNKNVADMDFDNYNKTIVIS